MPEKMLKINEGTIKVRNINTEMKDKTESGYTAILLCGGKGTRLAPLRGETPKPLFKVDGKELIRYTIELMDTSIVSELIFAVDYKKEEIKSWANSANLPYTIKFSEQVEPGIPNAVKEALAKVKRNSSVICSTDEIRDNFILREALRFHESHNLLATIVVTSAAKLQKHRVVEIDDNQNVLSIVSGENILDSSRRGLIYTGLFIIKKDAANHFDLRETAGSYGITKPLVELHQLKAYVKQGMVYFNVNTPEEASEVVSYLR